MSRPFQAEGIAGLRAAFHSAMECGYVLYKRYHISAPELFQNVLGQLLIDLAVSGNRLGHARPRIAPPIVASTMPHQDAADIVEAAYQIL
jgi:hypothetical protein